jgi:cytochrome c oxidase subunit II
MNNDFPRPTEPMAYQTPRHCQVDGISGPPGFACRIAMRRGLWFGNAGKSDMMGAGVRRSGDLRRSGVATVLADHTERTLFWSGMAMKFCGRTGRRVGVVALSGVCGAVAAHAATYGHAVEGQIGFQPGVTDIARYIHWFHNDILMPIITLISLFVLALLGYVVWKFDEKANPTPSKTTHNTLIEVAWTIVPVIILVIIAIPSFRLLTMQLTLPKADVFIKVTGSQWQWHYDYPKDQGDFGFDSEMKADDEIKPENGDIRLLSVDNEAVVPINKIVQLEITSAPDGVIHSFVIQSFGIRIDAVPGRANQTWFKADREGIYYGQCSKVCGINHAYMPIAFRVVSEDAYKQWLVDAKKKFAAAGSRTELADLGSTPAAR